MESINSANDPSLQTLNSVVNFLSTLNAGLETDDADAGAFANLLSQTQSQTQSQDQMPSSSASSPPPSPSPIIAVSQPMTASTAPTTNLPSGNSTPVTQPSLPALKKLLKNLRNILHYLHKHEDSGSRGKSRGLSASKAADGLSSTAQTVSVGNPSGTTPQGTVSSQSNNINSQTPIASSTTISASTAASTSTAGLSISDLLAKLSQLEQSIQQQIQNLDSTNQSVTSASTSTVITDSEQLLNHNTSLSADVSASSATNVTSPPNAGLVNNDVSSPASSNLASAQSIVAPSSNESLLAPQLPLTPAQALAALLDLSRSIETKLNEVTTAGASSEASAQTPNDGAQQPAATGISGQQAQTDLKSIFDVLRANAAARNDISSGTSSEVSATETYTPPLVQSNDTSSKGNATTSGATNLSQASQNSVLNLSNATISTSPGAVINNQPAVPLDLFQVTSGLVSGATSKDESSLNLDLNSQGQGASTQSSANTVLSGTSLNTLVEGTTTQDPYSFASQLSATRATNGGATGLPTVMDQVILQLSRNVKSGNDQMTIQLHPAELGRINIKLDFLGDNKVQGTIVASNPATLHLLLKDVRGIERALQEAGLRADPGSLQFNLGGQSGNSSGQLANNSSDSSGNAEVATADSAATTLGVANDSTEIWYLTPGRVNMKV
jgi:flagellar hook-length control protein FliK